MMEDVVPSGPLKATYLRRLPKEERLRRLRIPPAYTAADFVDARPDQATTVRLLKRYVRDFGSVPGKGLRLVGPPRRGKSYLAAAALKALIKTHELSGGWVSTRSYLELVMAGFGDEPLPDPYAERYLRRRYDVVVLDGLGLERRTDKSDSILGELLYDRSDAMLATIITTRLPLSKLVQRYGEDFVAFLDDTTMEVPV